MEVQTLREGLQQGERLNWYRIEKVLGRGGFGITYLGTDTNLDTQVAIKEYLPDQFAERNPDNSLRPSSPEYETTFKWGLDRFIKEAKLLARFKHPNIVRVFSVFEANGTAYMVMEFERGRDLKAYLAQPSVATEENLKTLFLAILDGLDQIHQQGFIHRDIKPSNIMIRENGSPVLIDFGSARQSQLNQTRTLTSLVSLGYTPLEQYSDSTDDKQGPWTDIYACGAVLYYAILGKPPVEATQRGVAIINGTTDPMRPIREIAPPHYSAPFLDAIDWALEFAVADRPKNIKQWSERLFAPVSTGASAPNVHPGDAETVLNPVSRSPHKMTNLGDTVQAPTQAANVAQDMSGSWDLRGERVATESRPATKPETKSRWPARVLFYGTAAIAAIGIAGLLALRPNTTNQSPPLSGDSGTSVESNAAASDSGSDLTAASTSPADSPISADSAPTLASGGTDVQTLATRTAEQATDSTDDTFASEALVTDSSQVDTSLANEQTLSPSVVAQDTTSAAVHRSGNAGIISDSDGSDNLIAGADTTTIQQRVAATTSATAETPKQLDDQSSTSVTSTGGSATASGETVALLPEVSTANEDAVDTQVLASDAALGNATTTTELQTAALSSSVLEPLTESTQEPSPVQSNEPDLLTARVRVSRLSEAIGSTDMIVLKHLSEFSPETERVLGVLFGHFQEIALDTGQVTQLTPELVTADLTIRTMKRASGTIARPSAGYDVITVWMDSNTNESVRLSFGGLP